MIGKLAAKSSGHELDEDKRAMMQYESIYDAIDENQVVCCGICNVFQHEFPRNHSKGMWSKSTLHCCDELALVRTTKDPSHEWRGCLIHQESRSREPPRLIVWGFWCLPITLPATSVSTATFNPSPHGLWITHCTRCPWNLQLQPLRCISQM